MKTESTSRLTEYFLRIFASLSLREFICQSRRETFKTGLYLLIVLLTSLILLTLMAEHYHLDIRWTALFFEPGHGWYLKHDQPWYWLNHYGTLPGLALAAGGLIGFCLSCKKASWQGLQRHFLLIILTFIIGPGLLVNSCFKDYWGRPRPKQTQLYKGQWEYQPVFSPGTPGRGKSFPCGDCSMGYAFLTLAVFRKRSSLVVWIGSFFALAYGSLLGLARMAAGGHFPTDVLWSFGIMTMVITVLYYWVLRIPDFDNAPAHRAVLTPNGRRALKLGALGLIILLTVLSRRPYFSSYSNSFTLAEGAEKLVVHANVDFAKTNVSYRPEETPRIVINTKGFAFPKAKHSIDSKQEQSGRTVHLYHDIIRRGYHADLNYSCEIFLPPHYKNNFQVDVNATQQHRRKATAG